MRTPSKKPGARGRFFDVSLAGECPESNPAPLKIQPVSEIEAEALAYGEAQPTGYQLAATRALWWRQARLGHRMPAEIGVIAIEGGRQ